MNVPDLMKFLTLDFVKTEEISEIRIGKPNEEVLGMEDAGGAVEEFCPPRYFLKGITPSQVDDLLNGRAFLEFWCMGIDHSGFTANGKKYPADVFRAAVKDEIVTNKLKRGSLYGETAHPEIEPGNDETTHIKNMKRVVRTEQSNAPHMIVGYRFEGDKTYFKIRTSLNNRTMVNDILNGRIPTFSIRTVCSFVPEGQGLVATNVKFITLDYVDNPASFGDPSALPEIEFIKPEDGKVINLKLTNEVAKASGFESADELNFIADDEELVDVGMENLWVVRKKVMNKPQKKRSLDDVLNKELRYTLLS